MPYIHCTLFVDPDYEIIMMSQKEYDLPFTLLLFLSDIGHVMDRPFEGTCAHLDAAVLGNRQSLKSDPLLLLVMCMLSIATVL